MLTKEQIQQIADSVIEKSAPLFESDGNKGYESIIKTAAYVAAFAIAEYDQMKTSSCNP